MGLEAGGGPRRSCSVCPPPEAEGTALCTCTAVHHGATPFSLFPAKPYRLKTQPLPTSLTIEPLASVRVLPPPPPRPTHTPGHDAASLFRFAYTTGAPFAAPGAPPHPTHCAPCGTLSPEQAPSTALDCCISLIPPFAPPSGLRCLRRRHPISTLPSRLWAPRTGAWVRMSALLCLKPLGLSRQSTVGVMLPTAKAKIIGEAGRPSPLVPPALPEE